MGEQDHSGSERPRTRGQTPNYSIDELIAVVEVTKAVVILNVLHELGLPAERQREIVQEHPQLRATARIARERLAVPGTDYWRLAFCQRRG